MTASPPATEHTGRLVLRTDQQEGLASTVRHLRRPRTRGHAVSACGTGKTLFALRVAEELGVRHLAVAVPSLDLIAQWAAAARADGRREPMITVSSLRAESHPLLAEAEVDSANAGEYLAYWLGRHPKATVFFTYDSLSKIEEAQHSAIFPAPVFGLLIVDEAHATAGTWEKNWTALHDNERIPAERRLYLTATPYVWEAPRLTEPPTTRAQPKRTAATAPAWDDPALLATMDQPKIFGPRLHTYSHADAIDDGVLADYQLVVPTITDTELRTALTDPEAGPTARRTTALHLAILKAMREQDLRHVFVYFQQIADAADFARQFAHTLRSLPDELRPDWADDVVVQSIDGTHSPHRRADIIARFTDAERGVLANAKILGEGVDIIWGRCWCGGCRVRAPTCGGGAFREVRHRGSGCELRSARVSWLPRFPVGVCWWWGAVGGGRCQHLRPASTGHRLPGLAAVAGLFAEHRACVRGPGGAVPGLLPGPGPRLGRSAVSGAGGLAAVADHRTPPCAGSPAAA
ncbi:DEAD/DEAH box helicase family protein [Streptomyces sp. NPDC102259]|uniref:DEAD/DEAH box helicase family protein n=1 Tax=Streptomyces sp. NPDC102259 TaxID=3366148 RepID=UPI003821C0E3